MVSLLHNYGLLRIYMDPNQLRKYLYVLDQLIQTKLSKLRTLFVI